MKFKTDENLPAEVAALLVRAGHDAMRIDEQEMSGATDSGVAAICQSEARAIVTFDLDFSDVRRYPPDQYAGIIVFRPAVQTVPAVVRMITRIIPLLETEPLTGKLWIVDDSRVRIRDGMESQITPSSIPTATG